MGTGGHRNRRLLSWQDHHRLEDYNGSPWRRGNEKFGDLANLADRIKAMGIEPGIWYRPLLNEDETIADQFRLLHNGYLDPSAPQALDYIRQDIAQLGERSYQLVKQLSGPYSNRPSGRRLHADQTDWRRHQRPAGGADQADRD